VGFVRPGKNIVSGELKGYVALTITLQPDVLLLPSHVGNGPEPVYKQLVKLSDMAVVILPEGDTDESVTFI
jgi:hypothetical protein